MSATSQLTLSIAWTDCINAGLDDSTMLRNSSQTKFVARLSTSERSSSGQRQSTIRENSV